MNVKCSVLIAMLGLAVIATFLMNEAPGQSAEPERWAVIASCCWYPWSASHDAQYMYHVLSEHYDFENICYLDVNTDLPGVNFSACATHFQWAIGDWLHGAGSEDFIFIFCVGHGGGYNTIKAKMEGGRIDGSGGDAMDEGSEHLIDGNWVGVDECINFTTYTDYSVYWDDELAADLNTLT